MSRTINRLEDLITPHLKKGQRFVSCECKNLLPSGENYGSIMLQVQVKILNENGDEEILHCVGKTVPPTEILWKLFNTKVTFKKEIAVYKVMGPELNKYGRELGIDCLVGFLAKCLGARISLDADSDMVDNDAVLLLENLKVQGYEVCDRYNGFDEDTARFLLRDLAVMHAGVIGYKQAKPEEFEKKFLPYLNKDYVFEQGDSFVEGFSAAVAKVCAKNPECVPHLFKIKKALSEMSYFNSNPTKGKEIFATLTHNDYWVNNTLVKFEEGKPVNNKMVDFQVIEYASLAHDVIFFLYSSVSMPVLEAKVDELIHYYYDQFIETLTRLNCDVSVYSFDSLLEELKVIARDAQFSHLLYMLAPILMLKAKELSEFNIDDLVFEENSLHENYARRMKFILLDFVKKGWI